MLPVLVTTAKLQVCEFQPDQVSLQTGNLAGGEQLTDAQWLILKHPFASTEASGSTDFRMFSNSGDDQEHWRMARRESLYVVQAQHLSTFLQQEPWISSLPS
jgi:hypothetical protein